MTFPVGEGEAREGPNLFDVGDGIGQALVEDKEAGIKPAKPISRVGRRGPKITFAEVPDRVDLAWIDGNNVVINSGHPCYIKVHDNTTAKRIHSLFAIANAVQRFVASGGDAKDLMLADRMMAAWGKK